MSTPLAGRHRLFWLHHDPAFCTSGAVFSQPTADGALQPGFWLDDCGALDAPTYLPTGSLRVTLTPLASGTVAASVLSMLSREQWANEPTEDRGSTWLDEELVHGYGCAAVLEDCAVPA